MQKLFSKHHTVLIFGTAVFLFFVLLAVPNHLKEGESLFWLLFYIWIIVILSLSDIALGEKEKENEFLHVGLSALIEKIRAFIEKEQNNDEFVNSLSRIFAQEDGNAATAEWQKLIKANPQKKVSSQELMQAFHKAIYQQKSKDKE